MTIARIAIARRELYEQLWAEPATKVAAKYGVSSVALGKTCRRHDIPRPPRGFWARIQAGQKPSKPPLPDPDRVDDIMMRDPDALEKTRRAANVSSGATGRKGIELEVSKTLRDLHPLTAKAYHALRECASGEDGFIENPDDCPLHVHVSRPRLRRTMLILDTLLWTFEQMRCPVGCGPTVIMHGSAVRFTVEEAILRKKTYPAGQRFKGPYFSRHVGWGEESKPSGHLGLSIIGWSHGHRVNWRDGKKQRLENCLVDFIAGIEAVALSEKEQRDKHEREEKRKKQEEERYRELKRQRAEKIRQIKEEQDRVDALVQEAEDWHQSLLLRRYIATRIKRETKQAGLPDPNSEFGKWVKWAYDQAERLDPLSENPLSVLDDEVPPEPPAPHRFSFWGG